MSGRLLFLIALIVLTVVPLASSQTVQFVEICRIPGDSAGDAFGARIAALGDIDGDSMGDFAVRAPFETINGKPNASAAYVYSGANCSLLCKIEGTEQNEGEGNPPPESYISGGGDVDGDGVPDIIVSSAPTGFGGKPEKVLIYSGASCAVGVVDTIYEFKGNEGSSGLNAVDAGDFNQDGFSDIAIAAPGPVSGKVLLLSGGIDTLSGLGDTLCVIFGQGGEALGVALTHLDDIDQDLDPELLIGAYHGGSNGQGRAFIFSGDSCLDTICIINGTPTVNDNFGLGCGAGGDIDGDGIPDLLVGDYTKTVNSLTTAGGAYVFSGAGCALICSLQSPMPNTAATYGAYLSPFADVNQDGKEEFLVSEPGADPNGKTDAGSVYLYDASTCTLLTSIEGEKSNDFFSIIASIGDITGDGFPELAVGAYGADSTGLDAGMVYVYKVCSAIPGDVNSSGDVPNLQDVIYLVNYIFDKDRPATGCKGTDPGTCWPIEPICRGDVNGSGGAFPINLSDVIHLVNFVFDKDRSATGCLGTDPGNCWTPVPSSICCLPLP